MESEYILEGSDNEQENEESQPMKILAKNEEIVYYFKFFKEGNGIHFILKESEVYAPFTFEGTFTLDEIIEHHKGFKSCDDINEVLEHLDALYKNKKISIENLGLKEERYLYLKAWDISEEFESEVFALKRKMTDNKDKALTDLYSIQKEQMKLLKKVQKYLSEEHPLNKEISKYL